MRHKHADLICAWANGAQIQLYRIDTDDWIDAPTPLWFEVTQYRVKPEPKPDIVVQYYASIYSVSPASQIVGRIPNLILTFDVETCELKSAEVMK